MKSSPSSKTTSGVKAAYAPLTLKDKVLRVLGPGLITGASDDDPSGIATYSQAGAQFGFSITWTLLFTYPFMAAIQEISGRIGRITGQGIAANLRQHYPNWLLQSIVALVLIANTINIVRPSFEQFAGRMVPPRLLVLNSHSRVGNTAERNSAGHIEVAHLGNLDSHIATVRSPAVRNSVADSPAANLGAGDSPHSD